LVSPLTLLSAASLASYALALFAASRAYFALIASASISSWDLSAGAILGSDGILDLIGVLSYGIIL
jgi:hypothetical protein